MRESYFEYLLQFAGRDTHWGAYSWRKCFKLLHSIPFRATKEFPQDDRRACDACDMRYRWAEYEMGDKTLRDYLPKEVSVFEVMVRLAVVIEERFMTDDDYGDRTSQWFFYMISSMGLNGQTDECINEDEVTAIVNNFLDRKYDEKGKGGLFYLPSAFKEMNKIELWDQAMHFIVVTYL